MKFLLSLIGKLLFPHLAPDQRHHRMVVIFMVMLVCLISIGVMISWMMSTRGIHIAVGHSLPLLSK